MSLTSWSLRLAPPLAGIWPNPSEGALPLVMVVIRYSATAGSSTFLKSGVPVIFCRGFSRGPTPPSRLAPWHWAQLALLKAAWPLAGSPGRPTPAPGDPDAPGEADSAAEADGEGEAAVALMVPSASRQPKTPTPQPRVSFRTKPARIEAIISGPTRPAAIQAGGE